MYQPYPGGAQMPEPSDQPPAPPSVVRAVQVMYAGAAASLIGIVIDMTTLSSTKSEIIRRSPSLTATQVANAEHVAIGLFIVSGLLGAALWVWIAQRCKAGRSWARITGTVLFAIDTLSVFLGAATVPGGGATRIYSILVWLIGLAAVILLWQRASSNYFRGAPRY
jgi:hypothetical protein